MSKKDKPAEIKKVTIHIVCPKCGEQTIEMNLKTFGGSFNRCMPWCSSCNPYERDEKFDNSFDIYCPVCHEYSDVILPE